MVLGRRRDPWWDLEGRGARRQRLRQRLVAGLAFVLALAACVGAGVGWVRQVSTGSFAADLDGSASVESRLPWDVGGSEGD